MNNRTGYGLRIVLGGYLAYLGIRMLIQTVSEKPANMMFMGAMRHCIRGIQCEESFGVKKSRAGD